MPLFVLEQNEDVPHSLGILAVLGTILGKIDHLAHALPAIVVLKIGLDVFQLGLLIFSVLGHFRVALHGILVLEFLDGDPGGLFHGGLGGIFFRLAGGACFLPLLVKLLHCTCLWNDNRRRFLGNLGFHSRGSSQNDGGVVGGWGRTQDDGLAVFDHLRSGCKSHHFFLSTSWGSSQNDGGVVGGWGRT